MTMPAERTRHRAVRLGAALACAVACALVHPDAARAHVAPSRDDNNRYLHVSLYRDRVRLVYTVFFGEVPGRAQRRGVDLDRDGALSSDETQAFARRLAEEVAGRLVATMDGRPAPVSFERVSWGSTSAAVDAGAFSVDLIATLCAPPGARHAVTLVDGFALPRPGETEVRLEAAPGVSIADASIGALRATDEVFRFAGPAAALREPGLALAYLVDEAAGPLPERGCGGPREAPRGRGVPSWAWALVGVFAALLGAFAALWARRRREGAAVD
ncbi:MAG: hypothetical protein R3B48_10755 [Kofleriaceae bacterium]